MYVYVCHGPDVLSAMNGYRLGIGSTVLVWPISAGYPKDFLMIPEEFLRVPEDFLRIAGYVVEGIG